MRNFCRMARTLPIVTNAGGGSSFCRGLAVTKSRHDATLDPGGRTWSATLTARPRSTGARYQARRASCSTPSSASASGSGWSRASVRLSFATGIASDRETAEALAQKYRDPSAASRTFALAFTHAQSGLRHLGISNDEALLFERLASRVLFADGSLRASPETIGSNEARCKPACGRTAFPVICPLCSCV